MTLTIKVFAHEPKYWENLKLDLMMLDGLQCGFTGMGV